MASAQIFSRLLKQMDQFFRFCIPLAANTKGEPFGVIGHVFQCGGGDVTAAVIRHGPYRPSQVSISQPVQRGRWRRDRQPARLL